MKTIKILCFIFGLVLFAILCLYYYLATHFNLDQFIKSKLQNLMRIWSVESFDYAQSHAAFLNQSLTVSDLNMYAPDDASNARLSRVTEVSIDFPKINVFKHTIRFEDVVVRGGNLFLDREVDAFLFYPNVLGPYPSRSDAKWRVDIEKITLKQFTLHFQDKTLSEEVSSIWYSPYLVVSKDSLKDTLSLKGALSMLGNDTARVFISCIFHLKDLAPSLNIEVWGTDLPVSLIEKYHIKKTHLRMREGLFDFRLRLGSAWDKVDGRIDFYFNQLDFKLMDQNGFPSVLGIPAALWIDAVKESKGKLHLRFDVRGTYEKLTFQMHDTSKSFFANLPQSAVKGGFKLAETIAGETISLPFKIIKKPFDVLFGKKEMDKE